MAKKFIALWLPVLFWCLFIFYLSSIPHLQATADPLWNFISRKTAHITVYAILALLVHRAFDHKKPLLALLLTVLYAITDEYHQTFVQGRTGHFSDIIFDLTGGISGIYILSKWKKLPTQLKKPKT